MTNLPEKLTFEIKRLTSDLRRLEERLKSEPRPDALALTEFRHALDNVRLIAWSVSELMNAAHIKENPDTVMAFLSAERLRRFNQLVKNLCGDIERGLITVETNGIQTLSESVNGLQEKVTQAVRRKPRA